MQVQECMLHDVAAPERRRRRVATSLDGLDKIPPLDRSHSKSKRRRGAGDTRCRGDTWPICGSSSELGGSHLVGAARIIESSRGKISTDGR